MNGIYNDGMPTAALNKKLFQEVPIYWATKNFITLKILHLVSIIWKCLRNIEGSDPKTFEFTMFSLVLIGCIPFEY
jgi:hypothetical protein